MLPLMMLQPIEIAIFDTDRSSSNLLPQAATEPEAAFADLLRFDVNQALHLKLADGQELPQGGNFLPLAFVGGNPTIDGDAIELRVELPMRGLPLSRVASATVNSLPVPGALAASEEATSLPAGGPLRNEQRPQPGVQRPTVGPAIDASRGHEGAVARQSDVTVPTLMTHALSAQRLRNRVGEMPSRVAIHVDDSAPTHEQRLASMQQLDATLQKGVRTAALGLPATPDTELDGLNRDARARMSTPAAQYSLSVPANSTGAADAPLSQATLASPLQIAGPSTTPASAATAAAAQASQMIEIPVQVAAWGERISERVLLMASNGLQSAEIRLSPPELGPLRVQVALDDGVASVTFHAQHALTREAIEQALPRLRELLAENGLTLSQADIGEQGVPQGSREHRDHTRAELHSVANLPDEQQSGDDEVRQRSALRPKGLVDTFA